jgi:uncharacterized protein with PIN domain
MTGDDAMRELNRQNLEPEEHVCPHCQAVLEYAPTVRMVGKKKITTRHSWRCVAGTGHSFALWYKAK